MTDYMTGTKNMTDFETYLYVKDEFTQFWYDLIDKEPKLEIRYYWFAIRLNELSSDQKEYFKNHEVFGDTYSLFLKQTIADLYREVEPLNAETLLLNHVMLSVMGVEYWKLKANIQ